MNETEAALVRSFGLTTSQLATVERAHTEAPKGLVVVALDCKNYGAARGNSGAGLLMLRITRGDHYDQELALDPARKRRTGWRYVRGSHAGTFVHDPEGTDELPRDYGPA